RRAPEKPVGKGLDGRRCRRVRGRRQGEHEQEAGGRPHARQLRPVAAACQPDLHPWTGSAETVPPATFLPPDAPAPSGAHARFASVIRLLGATAHRVMLASGVHCGARMMPAALLAPALPPLPAVSLVLVVLATLGVMGALAVLGLVAREALTARR